MKQPHACIFKYRMTVSGNIYRSVITSTFAIESLASETPLNRTKFHLNTLIRLWWSTPSREIDHSAYWVHNSRTDQESLSNSKHAAWAWPSLVIPVTATHVKTGYFHILYTIDLFDRKLWGVECLVYYKTTIPWKLMSYYIWQWLWRYFYVQNVIAHRFSWSKY